MLPTRLRFFCLFGTILVAGCASSSPGAAPATPGAVPAASAGGGNRPGEGVLYSPVSGMHYRLDSRDSLSMEMPDGSFQRSVTVKASYLTMTFESTAGGLNATIALDSMTRSPPNSMFQPLVRGPGHQCRGLAPTGRFESLEVNHPSLFGAQVRTMMSRLMPMLPAAGAEAGKTLDRFYQRSLQSHGGIRSLGASDGGVSRRKDGRQSWNSKPADSEHHSLYGFG